MVLNRLRGGLWPRYRIGPHACDMLRAGETAIREL